MNRDNISRLKKFIIYLADCKNVIEKIRLLKIDLAIDLYPYYPNSSLLLSLGRVNSRIGFATGGLEFLYTSTAAFDIQDKHVVSSYISLLEIVGFSNLKETDLKPILLKPNSLLDKTPPAGPIVIIHPGSGDDKKLWPLEKWIDLIVGLTNNFPGAKFIFTGSTNQEQLIASELLKYSNNGENLAGKLSWDEFCTTVSKATLLIGVDSVAGHVASAYSVPVVIVAAGMSNVNHWKPIGKSVEVLTIMLPCSPCYNGKGCENMKCIREISVLDVLHKAQSILAK